jgi:hypothetical protein
MKMGKFQDTTTEIADWHFRLTPLKKLALYVSIALVGVAAFVTLDRSHQKFTCDNGGLAVVVGRTDNNTLWDIAENHCTGNIQAAVDKLFNEYGNDIQPGQLIKLP